MIVITAPTGQIGRQLLERLVNNDADGIRVIARDPSRLSSRVRERVQIIQGSHSDLGVLSRALAGADQVFWLVPPVPSAPSVEDHFLAFTNPFCEAIATRGVQRVVAVSALGRGVAKNAGHVSVSLAMDEQIEKTGVSYRSLEMPGFMENMLQQIEPIKNQGTVFAAVSGDHKLPTCATRDIAAVAAELLLDDSWSGQEGVPILGPEDLSYNDMAQIMSDVLERPIRFQQIPVETYKATLIEHGLSQAWAQGLADMTTEIGQGLFGAAPRTLESTTPTTFRQWCEEVLKPAIA
ncbi:NAD(P)H-binding protein [Actinomadura sp. 6N118]|uniref:NmrA family NAD(P)-binding protein n=1 Tax=Actinomadura sp. 6N118 TaxID=3375151 RepID=UPI0037908E84